MCGITGYRSRGQRGDERIISRMVSTIGHRGPDADGVRIDDDVAFGHSRLAIIDLTESGSQPFAVNGGGYSVTFNGEIYNYKHIRKELEVLGHSFRSDSDTEVLIRSYVEWGDAAVSKFIGMFAFALYDRRKRVIKLVRDRAGVKPLYYFLDAEHFIFGSELKALMAHPGFRKQLNTDVLPSYLTTGYVPAPASVFRDCFKVVPGHILSYDLDSHQASTTAYWSSNDAFNKDCFTYTEDECRDRLERLLADAFEYRMVSDVDVGVFLSGGIDSSCVTALLQKDRDHPLRTFTVGFEGRNYDEAPYAKRIAEHLGTDHHEFLCSGKEVGSLIDELPYYFDEPFGDSSALPTMLVARKARDTVKVALSADGGDEAFCGYSKYAAIRRMANSRLPAWMRMSVAQVLPFVSPDMAAALNALLPSSLRQQNIRAKFVKFRTAALEADPFSAFRLASLWVAPNEADCCLKVRGNAYDAAAEVPAGDLVKRMMAWDYRTFMREDVLTKVDRATMSVGLEGREPFLDHRIIEFAARIPTEMHYGDGKGKYMIRSILAKYVPSEYFERPKMGFQLPLHSWLRNDLCKLFDHYLGRDNLVRTGVFDPQVVARLLVRYKRGKYVNYDLLWYLYSFQRWYERWLV